MNDANNSNGATSKHACFILEGYHHTSDKIISITFRSKNDDNWRKKLHGPWEVLSENQLGTQCVNVQLPWTIASFSEDEGGEAIT